MADNNKDDDIRHRMEAHEQTSKAQQEALDNIQQILVQLLTNRKNDNTSSNHKNEESNNNEPPKTDHSKEGSSIDAQVIKGIKAQITSLAQRDELKKVGAVRPYPLVWDSIPYPPKFKPPSLYWYDDKSSPNQHIYYFQS